MPLHQQRARNSIPPRRRRDRSRYPQTFQHNSELLVVRPAAAPTSLNDLEPFNLSTVLIDVHKDCYKSISQAQQGGRHRRKTRAQGRTPLHSGSADAKNRVTGLALSGGGIRAAALSIGAIHALSSEN